MKKSKRKKRKLSNHGESIRSILEQRPSWRLRWGTTVIAVIMAVLAVIIAFQEYPHSGGKQVWEVISGR